MLIYIKSFQEAELLQTTCLAYLYGTPFIYQNTAKMHAAKAQLKHSKNTDRTQQKCGKTQQAHSGRFPWSVRSGGMPRGGYKGTI